MNSDFPPSFQDNPWLYGFALFGMFFMSSVSLGIMTTMLLEPRHRRRVDRDVDNKIKLNHRVPITTTFGLYRFKVMALLLTIFLGVFPDVIFLLSWGETSDNVSIWLWTADRFFDGLAAVSFLAFTLTYFVSGGSVANHLAAVPQAVDVYPRWLELKQHLKTMFLVLFITAGVTIYKASR